MSYVANTILVFSVIEDEIERLSEVNSFFGESKGFVSCDDENLKIGWYGGTKMLETNLCIGVFNYLDLDGLIQHIKNIKWESPQDVQIIIQNQNDDKFSIIDF